MCRFEYFSEDPLVAGHMAAAITRGGQSRNGVGTTIKHFACNNQEDNRMGSDSIVPERALREIYLRGFEIAVKTAQPMAIMTSYNLINGIRAANSNDLCTVAAREEWNFQGIIMTDWTTTMPRGGSSSWGCIAAGNDLIMPGDIGDIEDIKAALADGRLGKEELRACVERMLVGCFGLGAAGAAWATIAAQGVSFVCGLVHMGKRGLGFPFAPHNLRPKSGDMAWILKVGLPLAMQDVLVHFSFLAIAAIINTLGLVASAAVGVAEKFMGFAFIPSSAFSSAVATMTAQNVGVGQRKRAVDSMKYGIGFSLVCGILICLTCQLVPEALIGIFSKDGAVITAGAQYIRTYSMDCVLVSFVFCMNAYFNGNGQSFICFAHSIAATFLIRIPVTWLMSKVSTGSRLPMGLAAPAASLFSVAVCLIYFWRREKCVKIF